MMELLSNFAQSVGSWLTTPENIGFIVLAIILAPILVVTAIALFSLSPLKASRIPALFLSSVVILIGSVLLSFAVIGVLLKFIVPQ